MLRLLNASPFKEDMASLTLRPEDILEEAHMSEGIVIYLKNSGINDIQRYHGGLRRFAPGEQLSLNSGFKTSYECIGSPEHCAPRIWKSNWRCKKDGAEKTIKAYSKIIHLVDPIVFQQRSKLLSYVPSPDAEERDLLRRHAISRHNQASVDATICYILSRIGELGLTPHSIQYLETVCGIADPYFYKITDDYMTLREERWFWSLADNGEQIHIEGTVSDEIRHLVLTPPKDDDIMCDSTISLNSAGDEQEIILSAEIIEAGAGAVADADLAEIATDFVIGDLADEEPTELIGSGGGESVKGTPLEDAIDALQASGGEIFLKCPNIPVLVCFQEAAEGTMDQLLEELNEDAGILDDVEAERKWSAWVFQIVAALSLYQRYILFCHNDLHTNNIVWVPTEEEFLYYKNQSGEIYKVPTYGKIFKIIDFGRATCEIGKKKIMSSDFAEGEDGYGQYNWGPFYNPDLPEMPPNMSFDLCRLAVSLFENLCPDEESRADSPLAQLLWKWMEDDGEDSVLFLEDGEERFPGFELYVHIAAHCCNAVPASQFREKPFSQFRVRGKRAKVLDAKVRAYPIFETSAVDDI